MVKLKESNINNQRNKIFNLQLRAQENLLIAEKEELVALEFKNLANILKKQSKSREKFVEKELELTQSRKNLVEYNKALLENRIKSKELLNFSEELLQSERDFINYHNEMAEKQLELAERHKKIVKLEEELAERKIKLADSRLLSSKIRIKLGKLQIKYAEAIQKRSPQKLARIKADYKEQKNKLNQSLKESLEREKDVNIIQNQLKNLTAKASE